MLSANTIEHLVVVFLFLRSVQLLLAFKFVFLWSQMNENLHWCSNCHWMNKNIIQTLLEGMFCVPGESRLREWNRPGGDQNW